MKVLYIIEGLQAGGKERRFLQLLKNIINKNNFEAELILLNKDVHYNEVFEIGVPIHYLKRTLFEDKLLLSKFYKICKLFEPDLVHCWDNIAAIQMGPICRILKIRFINSMISAAPKVAKLSKRYLLTVLAYPSSNIILSNSQAGLDMHFAPHHKQKVIYNGFDFNRIEDLVPKEKISATFKINLNRPTIGMVASFSKRKDYQTLIIAAQILKNIQYKPIFIAVGGGVDLIKMKDLAKEFKLDEFHFLGNQENIESIINLFNIGILLSNDKFHGEGFSNSIMEYMALGKPVIATKGGGTSELVIDGETGILIEPKNPKQLAEKISYLINNPHVASVMGQKGKERIKKYFTIHTMVEETYNLYKNVLTN